MLTQLVVRLVDHSLHLEPREPDDDPIAFDHPDEGQVVPRLGSRDLLRLASFALRADYHVDAIVVRDRTMTPLSPELEEQVSDRLIEQLGKQRNSLSADALSGERGPYTVVEIELVTPQAETIRVGRLGVIEAQSNDAADALLLPAWAELHLS